MDVVLVPIEGTEDEIVLGGAQGEHTVHVEEAGTAEETAGDQVGVSAEEEAVSTEEAAVSADDAGVVLAESADDARVISGEGIQDSGASVLVPAEIVEGSGMATAENIEVGEIRAGNVVDVGAMTEENIEVGVVPDESEVEVVEVVEEVEEEEHVESEEAAADEVDEADDAAEEPWEEVFVEVDTDALEEAAYNEQPELDAEEVAATGEIVHPEFEQAAGYEDTAPEDEEYAGEDVCDDEHAYPEGEPYEQSPTKSVSSQPTTVQELAAEWLEDEADGEQVEQGIEEYPEYEEDETCGTTEIVIARVEGDADEPVEETLARGYDVLDMMAAESGDGQWVDDEEEDVDGMLEGVTPGKRRLPLGTPSGRRPPKQRFKTPRQYNCPYCDWEPPPGSGWKPLKIEHMWKEHPEYKADHSCPRCGHFSTTKGWKLKHKCRVYAHAK